MLLFPKEKDTYISKQQKFVKVEATFSEDFSGSVTIKLLDQSTQATFKVRVTFQRDFAALDIANGCPNTVIFTPDKHLGGVDLRSIGYNKLKHGLLYKMNKYHRFKLAAKFCEEFNKLTHDLKKEIQESNVPYPLLDINDER